MSVINNDRWRLAKQIIEERFSELAEKVIQYLKDLPDDCRQSGDDSGLDDVWEEYKSQVQGTESIFFELYQEEIWHNCRGEAEQLCRAEQGLLWLATDDYLNDDYLEADEEKLGSIPFGPCLIDGLANELHSRVWQRAADERLKSELDEEEREDAIDADDDAVDEVDDQA